MKTTLVDHIKDVLICLRYKRHWENAIQQEFHCAFGLAGGGYLTEALSQEERDAIITLAKNAREYARKELSK